MRDKFDLGIKQKLGELMNDSSIGQADPEAVTPVHEKYGDASEGIYNTTPDIDDATPEYQDTYIGADVTILRLEESKGVPKLSLETFMEKPMKIQCPTLEHMM